MSSVLQGASFYSILTLLIFFLNFIPKPDTHTGCDAEEEVRQRERDIERERGRVRLAQSIATLVV